MVLDEAARDIDRDDGRNGERRSPADAIDDHELAARTIDSRSHLGVGRSLHAEPRDLTSPGEHAGHERQDAKAPTGAPTRAGPVGANGGANRGTATASPNRKTAHSGSTGSRSNDRAQTQDHRMTMIPSRIVALLFAFAFCALAPSAYAQGASADELLKQGNELAKKDRWAEAEALFRQAFELKKSYDIAGNLGVAETNNGKCRDAAEHLDYALSTFPANGKKEHKELLSSSFAKCRGEVGRVKVRVDREGAAVLVDGHKVGLAPLAQDLFLAPGHHRIEVAFPSYEAQPRDLDVRKGDDASIAFQLTPIAAPVAPSPGPSLVPGIILATVGLVGLVGGGAFLAVASDKGATADAAAADVKARGGRCSPITPGFEASCQKVLDEDSSSTFIHNTGVAGIAVGGAALAGSAVYFVWALTHNASPAAPSAAPRSSHVGVLPFADLHAAGLTFNGRF